MNALIVLMSILLSATVCYAVTEYADRRYELNIRHRGRLISSRAFWIVILFLEAGIALYSIFRLEEDIGIRYLLSVTAMAFMAIFTITDISRQIIPNRFILASLAVWVAICGAAIMLRADNGMIIVGDSLAGGLLSGGAFLLCYVISKRRMGAGDVKLAALMGLYLGGGYTLRALMTGVLSCAVYSAVQIIRKKMTVHDGVAMAPFLYFGTVVSLIL